MKGETEELARKIKTQADTIKELKAKFKAAKDEHSNKVKFLNARVAAYSAQVVAAKEDVAKLAKDKQQRELTGLKPPPGSLRFLAKIVDQLSAVYDPAITPGP